MGFTSPQTFAANDPHLKGNASPPPHLDVSLDGAVINVISPATYFLGCGTGWNSGYDGYQSFQYAYTTGSQVCSRAVWDEHDISQNKTCDLATYIPTILATAKISYRLYDASNRLIGSYSVDQNAHYGWNGLAFRISGIHHVLIESDNGETGTYMADSQMQFACY